MENNDKILENSVPWDFYNNDLLPNLNPELAVFPTGYSLVPSPFSLSLWSIKETKDDKKIANIFPYDKDDAGNGTFYSLVRPKIDYNEINRDSNGIIQIKGLSLQFEDAVRKSAWQNKYKIVNFNWDNINSTNEDIADPNIEIGNITETQGDGQLIDLSRYTDDESKLKQGFYKGQLISYYNESRPSFKITVKVNWAGYNSENWNGKSIIKLSYVDEDGVIQEKIETLFQPISMDGETISFDVRTIDKNGENIEYTLSEEFIEVEGGDENYWSNTINNQFIKYKGKNEFCKIDNIWTKTVYDQENESPNIIALSYLKQFYQINRNGVGDYSTLDDFIKYLNTNQAFLDWKQNIKIKEKSLKPGQIKAYFSDYIWNEDYIGKRIRLIPFMSIAERKITGSLEWYDFKLKTETAEEPNPFEEDMLTRHDSFGNIIVNPILITCPYTTLTKSNVPIYTFGTCPENLYYKKGCVAKGVDKMNPENPTTWIDDYDIDYLYPDNPDNNNPYTLFYAGGPAQEVTTEINYNIICSDMIISNTNLKLNENSQIMLKNFCLYFIDNMCLDTNIVSDGVPYYYKISVLEKATPNQGGILKAELCFNEKSEDFIEVPSSTGADPDPSQPLYKKHLLNQNSNNNFITNKNNMIYPNKDKIIEAYEGAGGELNDFIINYNVCYR